MAELVGYRAAAYPTPVRVRAHDSAARYHGVGSPPTQYLSLHPLGPWAEVIRRAGLAELEPALALRLPVWAVRVTFSEADAPFELGFDAAAADAGPAAIAPAELVADDQRPCRRLADAIRHSPDAPKALRVPSAVLPGTENLVIFGPRRMIGYEATPRRVQQTPAAVAAVDGRALADLLPHVRHVGAAHGAYDAWARGESYRLPAFDTSTL